MTNEPTTAEIVKALRCVAEETECKDCRYKYPVGNVILCDHEQMNGNAADRLESQERENASLRAENEGLHKEIIRRGIEIKTMTARAEQAEKNLHDAIFGTNHACFYCTMENCDGCTNSTVKEHFKYRALKPNKYLTIQDERGQPQDGEEK